MYLLRAIVKVSNLHCKEERGEESENGRERELNSKAPSDPACHSQKLLSRSVQRIFDDQLHKQVPVDVLQVVHHAAQARGRVENELWAGAGRGGRDIRKTCYRERVLPKLLSSLTLRPEGLSKKCSLYVSVLKQRKVEPSPMRAGAPIFCLLALRGGRGG